MLRRAGMQAVVRRLVTLPAATAGALRQFSAQAERYAGGPVPPRGEDATSNPLNPRLDAIWGQVCKNTELGEACPLKMKQTFNDVGFLDDDPRVKDIAKFLMKKINKDENVSREEFEKLVSPVGMLYHKASTRTVAVPDWKEFCDELTEIFEEVKAMPNKGDVASYIPELAESDPDLLGLSVCTVDGQRFNLGDTQEDFCLQSTSKAITYLMALEEHGAEKLHSRVWFEPSGVAFNELTLRKQPDGKQLPHNPMINAGAIICSAHVGMNLTGAKRFNHVRDTYKKLLANDIGFSNAVYLSEKETAHRNRCLGHMMMEQKVFPPNADMEASLEFYFQQCSLEVNCEKMAVLGATLANSGLNPLTPDKPRVFSPEHVKSCMALMLSCGMYDFSGEWAFRVGIPAKSGVSGNILMVLPNKMSFVIYSPPLDALGNSWKGIKFAEKLGKRFNFHHLEIDVGHLKKDPMLKNTHLVSDAITALNFAAAAGDLNELARLASLGIDLFLGDYDGRTALHLACSEGHPATARYLLQRANSLGEIERKDRWGNTPLNDAMNEQNSEIIQMFEKKMDALGEAKAY